MAKQFDLQSYIKGVEAAKVEKKTEKYVVLDECIQAVIGIPGVPLGHITQVYGKSDTGKTSLLFHTAAQAQKQNILPIFIMTEGKVDWDRAERMGVDLDKCIRFEDANFLEEAFTKIDQFVSDVSMGELPMDAIILWDSVGSLPSKDEVVVNKDGTTEKKPSMMKSAKVIRENIRVISRKINVTRNVTYPKSVGLMILNQVYTKPPETFGAPTTLVPYGGDAIKYASSVAWNMKYCGKLKAQKDGMKFNFGLISKLSVEKNHISDISMQGEFVITADAFMPNEKKAVDKYREEHRDQWGGSTLVVEDASLDD